ncbi:single-stranded-DNA-specific exonuclease RecJ [candidate division KSB1 bacterium]|nr:single-stranded-DNA-specific exonuclease RecJ [candidate division KSB1 bacterium]
MDLKWVLRDDVDHNLINSLADQLNVPKSIARILYNRKITDYDSALRYFKFQISDLYDPFLLPDMQKAVDRIILAMRNREKILIYGDYDVDGITSVSLIYLLLKYLGCQVEFYIPNRLREGYGMSIDGIKVAQLKGISLIITVDCGITAIQEVQYANAAGIDIIISDHHESSTDLPNALAVLNPKANGASYPFRELAGVGVAYKLALGLIRMLNLDEEIIQQYVDLVAIGSAADIVPLIDENRILVREGLRRLNEKDKPGLAALLESSGLRNKVISTGQIVFVIAPRINAVGRMGNAERAVRLLTTDNKQQARNIAAILEAENRERKSIDDLTFKEAQEIVDTQYDTRENAALVLDMDGWHPGVIGIVASRIVEKYYRPTVMISVEDGIGKGSARSIHGFDIYEAMKKCEDLMLGFGGHKYAAGLTIEEKKIKLLRERLNEIAKDTLSEDMLIPKLNIDCEIDLNDINPRFVKLLKMMAPFGPQNLRPVFLSRNLQVVGTPCIVGKNHLKFKVQQNGVVIDAIGFNLGDKFYRLAPGEKNLDLAYVVEENEYMGRTTLQLRIKDLR